MSREKRTEIIKKIEEKRNSKVITYITSDRQNLAVQIANDIIPIIHEHILTFSSEERKKIDLFIYSRGGDSNVPWALVSMIREYCKKGSFGVLVPFRAHSAATVISLGADEIIMTKKGELGPIDATISNGPYNPIDDGVKTRLPVSVEDVTGYFSLLKRFGCDRSDESMEGFKELTKKVHPLALGAVNRLLEETKLVGLRLLSTRAKPFTEEENHEIIKKLSSELYSHSHAITYTEATKFLGINHVREAESCYIEDEMWELFCEYNDFFQLNEPFAPDEYLIKNNLEEYSWENLKLACVESTTKLNVCQKSVIVRKLRNIPPNLNVNLNGVHVPGISLPTFPPGTTPKMIEELIEKVVNANLQAVLNKSMEVAVNKLMKSFPQRGFEHVSYDQGWKEE